MGAEQNEQDVRDFLNAWNEPKKLGDFFSDDAVFQMMAREPVNGRAAIAEELANQAAWATDFDLAVSALLELDEDGVKAAESKEPKTIDSRKIFVITGSGQMGRRLAVECAAGEARPIFPAEQAGSAAREREP